MDQQNFPQFTKRVETTFTKDNSIQKSEKVVEEQSKGEQLSSLLLLEEQIHKMMKDFDESYKAQRQRYYKSQRMHREQMLKLRLQSQEPSVFERCINYFVDLFSKTKRPIMQNRHSHNMKPQQEERLNEKKQQQRINRGQQDMKKTSKNIRIAQEENKKD